MDEQRQDDQLEPIHNSSVTIQDVALKTYLERWTIETGGGRRSERSVLAVRHDGNDDNETNTHNSCIEALWSNFLNVQL